MSVTLFGELLVSEKNSLDLLVKHELVDAAEAKKIAKKYGISLEKFPKILKSDPQAVKLNAHPGQLIAIHRNDITGKYVYYRYVIDSL